MLFSPKSEPDRTTETRATETAAAAAAPEATAPVVIDSSIHVKGDIVVDGDVRLEGTVAGDVTVKGHTLTIAREARVIGALSAGSIVVHGEVRGALRATDKIELARTGVARGIIHAPRFVLNEGCVAWGTVNWEPQRSRASKTASTRDRVPQKTTPDKLRACG